MISRFHEEQEFHSDERCYIVEIHNTDKDAGCSIARARVEPGVTTQLHCLGSTIERYVILDGIGLVTVGDAEPVVVKPLDVVMIPAGMPQSITNTGNIDLVFLCVCTPGFESKNYRAITTT